MTQTTLKFFISVFTISFLFESSDAYGSSKKKEEDTSRHHPKKKPTSQNKKQSKKKSATQSDVFDPNSPEIEAQRKALVTALEAISGKHVRVEGNKKQKLDSRSAPAKPTPPPQPKSFITVEDKSFVVTLPQLPGIALLKVYDDYWLFFDEKHPLSLPLKRPIGVSEQEDCSTENNSVFRFRLSEHYLPIITADKKTWRIDFQTAARMSRTQKIVRFPKSLEDPVKILLPQFKSEIVWMHPKSLVTYSVFTSEKQDGSFTPNSHYPQFSIVESYAGLGIQQKSDSLVARKDHEDLLIYGIDTLALEETNEDIKNTSLFGDIRSTQDLNKELKKLEERPETPDILLQKAILNAKMGIINMTGIHLHALEKMPSTMSLREKAKIDLLKLAVATINPTSENKPETSSFLAHTEASAEFAFWYALYKRTPQDYSFALKTFLPYYPAPLKNHIVEIILQLPDQHQTLKELTSLPGIEENLLERAKLKSAMMPPASLKELDSLILNSKDREIQADATFEWVQEKKRLGELDTETGIKKLEPYVISFGAKEFEAKFLLCDLYLENKDYSKAIKIYKDLSIEYVQRHDDLQNKIKETFLNFFKDVSDKRSGKLTHPNFDPEPLEIVAFYNDFQHLTPENEQGIKIVEETIVALKKLNLIKPAIEILNKKLETVQDDAFRRKFIFELAALHLQNFDTNGFNHTLESFPQELSENEAVQKQKLIVESHLLNNDTKAALEFLGDKTDLNSLHLKQKVHWIAKNYQQLIDLLPGLIEKADKSEKPEYITHLAAANLLVERPIFTIDELRQKFGNDVKGSPFEGAFHALTTPNLNLQEGMKNFTDLDQLLTHIKEINKSDPPKKT